MTPIRKALSIICGGAVLAGCATIAAEPDYRQVALDMIKQDFRTKGQATMERVTVRDEAQQLCSDSTGTRSSEVNSRIEASQMTTIKAPVDGKYIGNWQEGEKIAQSGRGMQSSDALGAANGGNCYACHQITKQEISFGNIGPSLYQYGKIRGNTEEMLKYTWGKIYNAQAYAACSNMPRFGHNGILTEAQLKDVMALLHDPASPVNK